MKGDLENFTAMVVWPFACTGNTGREHGSGVGGTSREMQRQRSELRRVTVDGDGAMFPSNMSYMKLDLDY